VKGRLPKAGKRKRAGHRYLMVPDVPSLTDARSPAPAKAAEGTEPESPVEELSEELTRTIKAAYQ
jgi:hypothetical protein